MPLLRWVYGQFVPYNHPPYTLSVSTGQINKGSRKVFNRLCVCLFAFLARAGHLPLLLIFMEWKTIYFNPFVSEFSLGVVYFNRPVWEVDYFYCKNGNFGNTLHNCKTSNAQLWREVSQHATKIFYYVFIFYRMISFMLEVIHFDSHLPGDLIKYWSLHRRHGALI